MPAVSQLDSKMLADDFLAELADAYFDLDAHALREDGRAALRSDAALLKKLEAKFLVEGHCDERGSAEYNLALGAMRAEAGKNFLVERVNNIEATDAQG